MLIGILIVWMVGIPLVVLALAVLGARARAALFGSWETNWLAYNQAHDLVLPDAQGPKLDFFMYPCAETAAGRLDCLDPDTFKYTIMTKELSA